MNKPLILVVEDDPAVARLISTTLETRIYSTTVYRTEPVPCWKLLRHGRM